MPLLLILVENGKVSLVFTSHETKNILRIWLVLCFKLSFKLYFKNLDWFFDRLCFAYLLMFRIACVPQSTLWCKYQVVCEKNWFAVSEVAIMLFFYFIQRLILWITWWIGCMVQCFNIVFLLECFYSHVLGWKLSSFNVMIVTIILLTCCLFDY